MAIEYDVSKAFKRVENELIDSMIRNLKRHQVEETLEGLNWEQWQALQLKELEAYRLANPEKFAGDFHDINKKVEDAFRNTYQDASTKEEARILDMIRKGKITDTSKGAIEADFFGLNASRLEHMVNATNADFARGEWSMLRQANDKYRQIIFDAQVYSATGATYAQAVDMATKDFLRAGIQNITYKNGARHTMQDYAEMAVRTGQKRAYLMGEGDAHDKYGIHTVRVNKRENACPLCVKWLGKVLVDDVYSGGTVEEARKANVPLLSEAIDEGFLHPNCKDVYTMYVEGISKPADKWTKEELEEIAGRYNKEQAIKRAEDMSNTYDRMARCSLDPINKERYQARADAWTNRLVELQDDQPPTPITVAPPPKIDVTKAVTQAVAETAVETETVAQSEMIAREKLAREKLSTAKDAYKPKADKLAEKEAELKTIKDAEKTWETMRVWGDEAKERIGSQLKLRQGDFADVYEDEQKWKMLYEKFDIFRNGEVEEALRAPLQAEIKELKKEVKALAKELDMRYDEVEQIIGAPNVSVIEDAYEKKNAVAMRHMLVDAPETERSVWNKMADDFNVLSKTDWRGKRRTGNFYSPREKGVNVTMKSVAKGNAYEPPYETAFHEFGHNMDYAIAERLGLSNSKPFSATYQDGIFGKTVRQEADEAIEKYGKENGFIGKANRGKVMQEADSMIKRGLLREDERLDYIKRQLQTDRVDRLGAEKAFNKYMKETYSKRQRANISDMFESSMQDPKNSFPFGFGHGSSYWGKNAEIGMSGQVGVEAFAEMYASVLTNPESVELIEQFFPKSFKIFKEMLEDVNGRLG